jgi:hypothetical protein
MSSSRVAPREATVVASPQRRSQPSGPCKRFVDLFLPRGAPPAVVRFLAFRNHYAHAVTIRARDAHGTWRDVLRDTRLMADPHYEDDATQIAVLELPNEGVSLDGRDESAVRVYFSNPSPRWAHVEVGASHFAAYESGDPEVMLAELTRRVQRAIREARAGGAGGEPTRADEKRNSLRERETPFICPESREVAEGPSARAATRSMSGDRFRSDALAAFDDVRRALRDAEVSRTKTRVVRSADSVVVAEENARRPAPAVATGSALVTSLV